MTEKLVEQPRPHDEGKRIEGKSGGLSRVIAAVIVLAGVALMLYPVTATWWQNKQQAGVARSYTDQIQDRTSKEERERSLAEAREWNHTHAQGPILDPWLARVDKSNYKYQAYLKQLGLNDVMARIKIPAIASDLPVYHGTDEQVLNKGVGHLFGSSLPVGGEGTHAVLTGHTGLSHATLWDNLTDVKLGDAVYINVAGETLKYEVDETTVVLPNETDNLRPVDGKDLITLITCTPYGVNSHRLLVTAHRVPMDPAEADRILQSESVPWQWWMTAVLAAVALVLTALVWWLLKTARSRRDPTDDQEPTVEVRGN